jgi:hypothetical protein
MKHAIKKDKVLVIDFCIGKKIISRSFTDKDIEVVGTQWMYMLQEIK